MSSSSDHSDDNPLWGLLLPACFLTPPFIMAVCCCIAKKIHDRRVQNSFLFASRQEKVAEVEIEISSIPSDQAVVGHGINVYPTMAHAI
jgi:hypothetical protein